MAAKKLNSAALKIVLRHYYHGDANKCRQIIKMLRGESSETPDTLMHLIVSYWKEKYDAPPDVAAIINGHDDIHRKEPKLSVHAMREMLLKAHHGDIPLCNKIKKAVKGNASPPDTLVHMINLLSNCSCSSSSLSS